MKETATIPTASMAPLPGIPIHPPGTHLIVLENGLTLIVREDHSAPVVSAQAWCKAGSVDEGKWLGAGLSHTLEHMLFKGTTTRGPGRIDQEVQEAGGNMNAYTSFDRTVYWINVPNTGARTAIDILCDIAQNATLPPEELAKEKQVILREMDMNQDDPHRRSSRRLFETAYTTSPYRYTVIGYPDIFEAVQREDVLAYYREKYAPNNLFLVVTGDIRTAEVEEQVRQAFKGVKARPLPPTVLPAEPRQIAPREVVEEAPIEMAHFHVCWHIPDLRDPDVPLLDILATLLGTGHSSRLYQEVREKQGLVHSVDAWTYSPGKAGLLGLSAMTEAQQYEPALAAMMAEIERMKAELVAAAELAKAVKQFTAGTLASRKTMHGQAQDLGGCWMAVSDLNFSERYLAAIKQATPEDLRRVARHYLTPENRTLYALLPKGASAAQAAAADARCDQEVQKIVLPNGLRLLVKEDHRLPFVEIRSVFQGGVLSDTPEKSGRALLMAKLLVKGTRRRTAGQIATEIESVGGSLDSYGGNNSFGVNAEVLSSDFGLGLDLLAEVILDPVFPAEVLELEKQMQLATIKAQRDQLLQSAAKGMRRALFGNAAYGLETQGTEESVPGIQVEDLRAAWRELAIPNNCVLAIYGDVHTPDVKVAVEKAFGGWAAGAPVFAQLPVVAPLSGIQRVIEEREKNQAVLLVGFRGVDLHHPDRFALELLQESCSDLGSRLFLRIRENLGLAYYVGAQNFLGLVPGYFAFYAGTTPEKAALVEAELLQEAALLARDGLTEAELRRAKAKLIGQKKIARQDLGSYAMTTALDELYGLGYANTESENARFEAVTMDDLKEAARRYLTPNQLVFSMIAPAQPNLCSEPSN